MAVHIVDYQLPDETHNLYDVTIYDDEIHTLVTNTPSYVDSWISDTQSIHRRHLHRLIVGLDVEWRPNNRYHENPVATLQLCVGHRCLVFQILHSPGIPYSLEDFLSNPNYTFVGVGVKNDVEKLTDDYGLQVENVVDLRVLAVEEIGVRELGNAGLKELARRVLGMEVDKPRNVTLSRWDNRWLTPWQVKYACVDAFLSFEIGRALNAA